MGIKAHLVTLETRIIRHEYEIQCLQILTENTAKLSQGKLLSKSWTESRNTKPEDTRTAEEITADVVQSAGLTVRKSK